MISFISDYG